MKKVMFLMAAVSMFAFAACNQKAAEAEATVETEAIEEVVAEPVVEEVIDSANVAIEEVAAETTEQAQ